MIAIKPKSFTLFTALFFFILSFINISNSQWIQTGGPEGGEIDCIVQKENILYAGGAGGIFISSNNGSDWHNLNSGLPNNTWVYSITFNGNDIFIGTRLKGIFKSSDEGLSWIAMNTGLPAESWAYTLYIASNGIYAGIYNSLEGSGIYFSSDMGNSWIEKNSGLPSVSKLVTSFIEINGKIFASTTYFSFSGGFGIYASTNNGNNWFQVNNGLGNLFVRHVFFYNNNLYAATAGGVYISTNEGASWSNSSSGMLPDSKVRYFAVKGSTLIAGTSKGVYHSSNGGAVWQLVSAGLLNNDVYCLCVSEVNEFAGTMDGIYISSNNISWFPVNSGIISTLIGSLVYSNHKITAGLWLGGLASSYNNGNSWSRSNNGLTDDSIRVLIVKGNIMYAGTSYIGVFKSTNNGASWFTVNNGITGGVSALASSGDNIYSNAGGSVYVTSNGGNNWASANNGLEGTLVISLAAKNNYVFAGTFQNGVFISTNFGASWNGTNGSTPNFIISLLIKDNLVFAGSINYGLFASSNNGITWVQRNNGITALNTYSILKFGSFVFAGTDSGVFSSSNDGLQWNNIGQGLKSTVINQLITNGIQLFAGTNNQGVWEKPLSEIIPYYTVSGTVKYSNNNQPVSAGKVKALYYDESTDNIIVIDSAIIGQGGYYSLQHVPQEKVFIMAYPNDELDFVPTYYPSTTDWHDAVILEPAGNLENINISVFKINNLSNAFSISGTIYKSANNSYTISDAVIYTKANGVFKSFGVSSAEGLYTNGNLSPDNYTLSCNRIGYNNFDKTVIITSSNQVCDFYLVSHLIGTDPGSTNLPKEFNLYQNYPNPFNPETNIKFDIPADIHVKLIVYDILGREIKVLVNEVMQAGNHNIKLNASNLSSGIYFYKIEAGDYISSKKMVVLK